MDAIQLAQDVHIKKINSRAEDLIDDQNDPQEANLPLVISHILWLRKIKGCMSKIDIMHQNERKAHVFKFLCKHNLLFFLIVTRQLYLIEQLFIVPSCTLSVTHLVSCRRKKHYILKTKSANESSFKSQNESNYDKDHHNISKNSRFFSAYPFHKDSLIQDGSFDNFLIK